MDEILLILADSSDIYEFSSKQVDFLDDKWSGSWVVSDALGSAPELQGALSKNPDIFNEDAFIGEDYRKTYKIFEEENNQKIVFNTDIVNQDVITVSGTLVTETSENGVVTQTPVANKYAYITIKPIFINTSREIRIKTDINGEFNGDINIDKTIRTPANSFFIFQISPTESEQLSIKKYYLSVEIRQIDINGDVTFRKEVLQAKLNVVKQGVL